MITGWQILKKYCALVLCGMSTITLFPSNDYSRFVSTPEQITHKSWLRTGKFLRVALEKDGCYGRQRESKF